MRAVICNEFGPVEDLRVEERPDPVAGPGGVVVDVEASGVNFVDALFVQGKYQIKPPTPFIPGGEIAGRISAVGEGVTDRKVGDRVLVSSGLGGFATALGTSARSTVLLPDELDAPRAATFVQSFCTALFTLRRRTRLEPGERVLVLGAGGGVGLATIQVAKALGAQVLAAASTEEKRAAALVAGADAAVDTTLGADHLKSEARDWAVGNLDLVVDPIGGEMAEAGLRALGNGGRFCVIGFATGDIPTLPANQILLRNRTVVGVDWGAWAMNNGEAQGELLDQLLAMVAKGELDPVAPTTRPLDDIVAVLSELLDRKITGKVALVP